jgi:hypothetical protein
MVEVRMRLFGASEETPEVIRIILMIRIIGHCGPLLLPCCA